MSFSDGAKINFNKLNADEAILVCLEISHPFISQTVRLVRDNKNLISNGDEYIAMPFDVQRQSDVRGELPKITLTIANVGRELVKWVDSSGGGIGALIKVKLIRRSSPNLVEESINLGINSVSITTEFVTFNLIVQNNLVKRACRLVYDIRKAPGLF